MKANHNRSTDYDIIKEAVLNFVKKQNESKSQLLLLYHVIKFAVLNFVKKQNESKSQQRVIQFNNGLAVLNFAKKQNESKSQQVDFYGDKGKAVLNFVKKQNESKSQLEWIRARDLFRCFKLCQKTKCAKGIPLGKVILNISIVTTVAN